MKICPVGAELFLVDSRTDMTKLIVAFLNANTPKNQVLLFKLIWKWYSVTWMWHTSPVVDSVKHFICLPLR